MSAYTSSQQFIDGSLYSIAYIPEGGSETCLAACMPLGDERRHVSKTLNDTLKRAACSGIAGAMYDYPGMGESTGNTADFTLAAALEAGEQFLEMLKKEHGIKEYIMLGIRSGCFTAVQLAGRTQSRCILWQPFNSGAAFLRELKLKEKIRGELTGGAEKGEYFLNGGQISETLLQELEACTGLSGQMPDASRLCIIQISKHQAPAGPYKDLPPEAVFFAVNVPPFWNPHEGWDTSALAEHTVGIISKDE